MKWLDNRSFALPHEEFKYITIYCRSIAISIFPFLPDPPARGDPPALFPGRG
ncbi:hypothetical protein B4135_4007 [Caldibacillus debilis]|uniref:Uncharacterized protein n=1 Tax=Caldibacillus debilis TaxID=301148 RepID=A0A150L8J0_9BACI|nr:hypothetical protein B4135_4007 [Caldibacillus debilis]